jgi:hypothetical protein
MVDKSKSGYSNGDLGALKLVAIVPLPCIKLPVHKRQPS